MDFDGLFEQGKTAVELLSGTIDVGSKIRNLFKGSDKGGVSPADVAELTIQLQNQLIGAHQAQLMLLNALLDAKSEMMQFDRRTQLDRSYELFTTPGGAVILRLKGNDERVQSDHYICPNCADQEKRTVLQPQGTGKKCGPYGQFFPFSPSDNHSSYTSKTSGLW